MNKQRKTASFRGRQRCGVGDRWTPLGIIKGDLTTTQVLLQVGTGIVIAAGLYILVGSL